MRADRSLLLVLIISLLLCQFARPQCAVAVVSLAATVSPDVPAPTKSSALYYARAERKFSERYYANATRLYRLAINIGQEQGDPKSTLGHYHKRMGDAYFHNQHYKQARSAYRVAIQMNPDNGGAHFGIARVSRELGDFDEASRHLDLMLILGGGGQSLARTRAYRDAMIKNQEYVGSARTAELIVYANQHPMTYAELQDLEANTCVAYDVVADWASCTQGDYSCRSVDPYGHVATKIVRKSYVLAETLVKRNATDNDVRSQYCGLSSFRDYYLKSKFDVYSGTCRNHDKLAHDALQTYIPLRLGRTITYKVVLKDDQLKHLTDSE